MNGVMGDEWAILCDSIQAGISNNGSENAGGRKFE